VFETDADGNPIAKNGILEPNDANSTNDAFLNPYLGLTMEVTFQQPVGGKISNMGSEKPMSFRFSGDDDVWIFIDGVLVADIGGIHDIETATINFSTGNIKIDRTERFEEDDGEISRKETTIRKQFEEAGALIDNEMNGDTFADNTVHTLTMFYMERGNQASNLELEFNLQEPQYSTLKKVNQDGNGLKSVTFDLYEADDNWQPVGEKMATLTTGEDGSVNLTKVGEDGVERIIFFEDGGSYLLREVETLPGYVTQGDIHLTYNARTATLTVVNKWETGAVGGFKAQLTMTDKLLSAKGEDLTVEAQRGLIIAVPMYNPNNGGMQATEGWIPLYGSTLAGFRVVEMSDTTDEAYRRAVLEAAFRQFANPDFEDWSLHWNSELERFEGTLKELPGAVENYTYVDRENGNILTAYYLFDPNDGLFAGCKTDEDKCMKLEELT
jgi:fibro-slime domain-containing protein